MGGEGSMASANTTLKNNRNLLSKRKEKNALLGSYANAEMKDFPEATPEQLSKLKQRLKKENRRAIVKNMLLFIVLAVLVVSFFLYFFF
ncbi:hypothetical protein WJN01_14785 [Flavobacteriaceae bacterium SZ-1-7]|uniref:hypothetical protein n=1 Tax=Tamlana sedimenti TaxID=3134126 RepID=UPI003124AF72